MKRIIYIIIIAVLLSGCHIYKRYERPKEIHVSESFRLPDSTTQTSADTITTANLAWQDVFTDPKLQALINYGIEHNTDLLSAIQKVNAAKAALVSSKLSFLPSLTIAPQGGVSSFNQSPASWNYNVSVNASWEIDLFGKLMNAKRQAKVIMLQNVEYKQAVRTQLIATIADYYYTLITLDRQLDISLITEANWKNSVATIKEMKKGGMVDAAAVSQSEANYYMISATIPDLKANIMKQENALSTL
ncbi:MAG: TolC family protein, partial [Bacteroidales bacterium]